MMDALTVRCPDCGAEKAEPCRVPSVHHTLSRVPLHLKAVHSGRLQSVERLEALRRVGTLRLTRREGPAASAIQDPHNKREGVAPPTTLQDRLSRGQQLWEQYEKEKRRLG